jgi:hypothetical protein
MVNLLTEAAPCLILLDETLEYLTQLLVYAQQAEAVVLAANPRQTEAASPRMQAVSARSSGIWAAWTMRI